VPVHRGIADSGPAGDVVERRIGPRSLKTSLAAASSSS